MPTCFFLNIIIGYAKGRNDKIIIWSTWWLMRPNSNTPYAIWPYTGNGAWRVYDQRHSMNDDSRHRGASKYAQQDRPKYSHFCRFADDMIIIIISYDITIRIMLYTDWSLCLMRLIWSASKFNNGISFTCQILLLFIFKILLITSSINPRNSYQYKWRNILWTFSTFL